MKRYSPVTFEIVGEDGRSRKPRGVVIVRDTEMVLEVECPGDQAYLIRGKDCGGFYDGFNEGLEGDVPVHATWSCQGGTYKGTWVEDNEDYTFSFRLPAASPRRASN